MISLLSFQTVYHMRQRKSLLVSSPTSRGTPPPIISLNVHRFISISGNLYYALTHSPEPLTEEYSYALSWEAATERLESAGCISVKEAEAMREIHSSAEASVEVSPQYRSSTNLVICLRLTRLSFDNLAKRLISLR